MDEEETKDLENFIRGMEDALAENDFKNGWIECDTTYLIEQWRNKVFKANHIFDTSFIKLVNEYQGADAISKGLYHTLADLANYSMMIANNIKRSLR